MGNAALDLLHHTIMNKPPHEIFKAYDIRGIVGKTLTNDIIKTIGHSIGSEAQARGLTSIAIGRDGRLSGSELSHSLAEGIQESGINVLDVGMVATPMLYFAAHELCNYSGVMVTGSHNPPDYNGLKIVLGGETLAAESIQNLRVRIENNDFIIVRKELDLDASKDELLKEMMNVMQVADNLEHEFTGGDLEDMLG